MPQEIMTRYLRKTYICTVGLINTLVPVILQYLMYTFVVFVEYNLEANPQQGHTSSVI